MGAALWCLYRFQSLERERLFPHRSPAGRLRGLASSCAGCGALLAGVAACLLAGLAFALPARPSVVPAMLYCALCAAALASMLTLEGLALLYRIRGRRQTRSGHRRRAAANTLMRAGPPSRVPL